MVCVLPRQRLPPCAMHATVVANRLALHTVFCVPGTADDDREGRRSRSTQRYASDRSRAYTSPNGKGASGRSTGGRSTRSKRRGSKENQGARRPFKRQTKCLNLWTADVLACVMSSSGRCCTLHVVPGFSQAARALKLGGCARVRTGSEVISPGTTSKISLRKLIRATRATAEELPNPSLRFVNCCS